MESFNTASGKYCCNTEKAAKKVDPELVSFNTASGKYCCNLNSGHSSLLIWIVSIPQAVSTVATIRMVNVMKSFTPSFNTASGKYCCNFMKWLNEKGATLAAFQYRKR